MEEVGVLEGPNTEGVSAAFGVVDEESNFDYGQVDIPECGSCLHHQLSALPQALCSNVLFTSPPKNGVHW